MSNWTDLLRDAAPIKAIYGLHLPTLEGIDLHEICLHRDGPRALLRFDLKDFPSFPPKKWSSSGFNRVQIRLCATDVQSVKLEGLGKNMVLDLAVVKDGARVRLRADNGVVRFDMRATSVFVETVSAYKE
ncbi:MAG: hypothetical protein GTN84_06170 [Hydrogenophaga sp.]|uniref:Imm50 family immunity protein n=1 Tax=Hydrogenophaga sp. TaxID=1904254 RepID=UPI0016977C62|nr:Imm50 family immunity protein [Hydrogenophaga sp.]NIM40577.1 hypothetical protein [Hydrogenophaga sp.]NIN25995.1 hypothetical protein [Hydrogenophaga sp.]NIN30867.1 hypothetical protein [Hydrogenophaga sp.]NIN54960.1 hypothetical protein [Hydrogenophaga sp.]NIO51000.1 hypothetical protein [Hydrogenophaga sp.]